MSDREKLADEIERRMKVMSLLGGMCLREAAHDFGKLTYANSSQIIAALRAQDREDGAREMRERAYEAVCSVRHAAACNFTPAFSGALGEARTNSLAEAARAVQALSLSPARKEDGDAL